jgi:hypothetical protein
VPDEALRKLSSTEYIITRDNTVIIKDKIYRVDNLPLICQFKIIPITKEDVIEYTPKHRIEEILLALGYARECADAIHILVPPKFDENMFSSSLMPLDLIVRRKDGDVVHVQSARTADALDIDKADGKYIYLNNMPTFTGDKKDSPITYTNETMIAKCTEL